MEERSGIKNLRDNGGTRSGYERRLYTATIHIPERRSGHDRRSGKDRRKNFVAGQAPSAERRAVLNCRQKPLSDKEDADSSQRD